MNEFGSTVTHGNTRGPRQYPVGKRGNKYLGTFQSGPLHTHRFVSTGLKPVCNIPLVVYREQLELAHVPAPTKKPIGCRELPLRFADIGSYWGSQ
ncbi:hypothetical protein AVEN_26131-1 [Araneus ventricosus]|uniref:Uncharacterized protein n=1 Tax=Araneus ventricosus TaxID=182803 RepID=A0A4Y2L5P7_ARAVE|nr:hypothetical protein AVEN_26131-1 [Araneus ventricosus]